MQGQGYIYPDLDWHFATWKTVGNALLLVLASVLAHFLIFGLYSFRVHIHGNRLLKDNSAVLRAKPRDGNIAATRF